jgi:O-antigen/teichoic acid export membrane protein
MLGSRDGRDSLLTYAAEGLALVGMVLAYRLAAMEGRTELDQYVVVRRTVSFIYPLLLLGAAVGVTRFVAMRSRPEEQRRYLIAALSWSVPLALAVVVLGLVFASPLSWLVFGSGDQHDLVPPLALMIGSVALYGLSYSFLRGQGHLVAANTVQVLALAGAPCAAFLVSDDLVAVCWITGCAWTLLAAAGIMPALLQPNPERSHRERGELLRYGLPRVPGDLAMGALLTVPVYMVARTHGLSASGEIGFGATLLNLAAAVFSPLSLVLLPSSASQLAAGDHAGLSRRIGRLSMLTLLACAAMTLVFEVAADPILHIYLGDAYAPYVSTSRIVFLGALPFGVFIGLRSVLDAYYHTPRNGINLTKAFLILIAGGLVHFLVPTPSSFVAWVLVAALAHLGWATWRDVRSVRAELDRFAGGTDQRLRIMVVIPAAEESDQFSSSRRQARSFSEVHGAEVGFFHLKDRSSLRRLLRDRYRFKRQLRTFRPDVVHVHYGSVSALFAVLNSPVPVVISFLGSDLDRPKDMGAMRTVLGRFFSQVAAFFSAGIICTTQELRELLWWRQDEVRVIPHGDAPDADGATIAFLRSTTLVQGAMR